MTPSSILRSLPLLALALTAPVIGHAATVSMTASDGLGTSSFNAAGTWSPAGAPTSGNDYTTLGFLLRSPSASGSYTFAGDSLTVGGGSGGGTYDPTNANNNALIYKAANTTLTVNNLILDGSQIRDGLATNNTIFLNGNINVTANGGTFVNQAILTVNSAISGTGLITIGNNGSGEAGRATHFASASSTFTGNIQLNGSAAGNARLIFDDNSLMNFSIGSNGINNAITAGSGKAGTLTLNGDFKFDLSGAGTTLGDSWTIIGSSLTTTYGSTFSVQNFTQDVISTNLWTSTSGGIDYQYDTTTGTLSVTAVPEPWQYSLALVGLVGVVIAMRRRRSEARV
jgi:hypothetical protein